MSLGSAGSSMRAATMAAMAPASVPSSAATRLRRSLVLANRVSMSSVFDWRLEPLRQRPPLGLPAGGTFSSDPVPISLRSLKFSCRDLAADPLRSRNLTTAAVAFAPGRPRREAAFRWPGLSPGRWREPGDRSRPASIRQGRSRLNAPRRGCPCVFSRCRGRVAPRVPPGCGPVGLASGRAAAVGLWSRMRNWAVRAGPLLPGPDSAAVLQTDPTPHASCPAPVRRPAPLLRATLRLRLAAARRRFRQAVRGGSHAQAAEHARLNEKGGAANRSPSWRWPRRAGPQPVSALRE